LPSAAANSKAKWVIKIRLYTPSHSIRPRALNYWNAQMGWAKLHPVGKKRELLLELRLADTFRAQDVYDAGLSSSKLCISALNMGSLGYFWYDLPRQATRYFESVRDLDAPTMGLAIDRP